jgi:purine-binding chemotaxis protein CheW
VTDNIFDDELIEDSQKNKFLTFKLSEETFGIEIRYVTEIVGLQPVTKVPELPEFIVGIINLRGIIFPIMDARLRFKKESIDYNDRTCIIVINVNNLSIGLIVDSVSEVLDIEEDNIVLPPSFENMKRKFVKNIGKSNNSVVLILDCDQLLDSNELNELELAM